MIDQAAITDIFKILIITGKCARWYLTSTDYDIILKYTGKRNTVADAVRLLHSRSGKYRSLQYMFR